MGAESRLGRDGELLMVSSLFLVVTGVFVNITGAPPFPDLPDSCLCQGEAIEELQTQALDWYLSRGYPFAAVATYFSNADTLTVNVVPGRHALLEAVVFPDSVKTSPSILLRDMHLLPGDPYSQLQVFQWLDQMERLAFIESAGPCEIALGSGGNILLTVPVQEAPPGWFSGDLDFSSSGGFTGGGETVFTNLFGTGRRLEVRLSAVDWGGFDASGLYREPWILGSPVSAQIEAFQQVPDSGSVIREFEGSIILSLGAIEISGGGGTWQSYPAGFEDESYRFGSAGVAWDLTRSVPQGRKGFKGEVTTDAGSASGPDSTYFLTRASGELSYNWFRGALGLGMSVKSGGIISGEWLSTMVTGIGGYGTLRGYVQDSWRAGTWGVASGEVSLGETSTRMYLFTDAGILNTGADGTKYPVSAGAGLRGTTGPFQFDAGTGIPVGRGTGSARFYLSARVNI